MAPTLFSSRVSTLALVAAAAAALFSSDCAAAYSTTPNARASSAPSSITSSATPPPLGNNSRRAFLSAVTSAAAAVPASAGIILAGNPSAASAAAAAATKESLVSDLRTSGEKLAPIPQMLIDGQWDPVRTILKTPPVNQLWNLGESQNTLVKLAKETGEFDLIELKDELAISLQMCDQYTYDNAFVYFQPGNGKVKLKEPTEMARRAMRQIQDALDIVG